MTDVIDITFVTKTEQLDKAYRKSAQLEKKIRDLATAEAKGKITSKQYAAQINKLALELQKVSGNTTQARNAVMAYSETARQAAKEQAAFTAAAQASQKAMHRKGVVMQQLGYQTGDFLVQIQSGTNAFVAFGQQATQLVGVMGMLNPKWIGLSAGLGIAIPLLTAVGAYFMRTSEGAEKASDTLSDLSNAVSEYSSAMEAAASPTETLSLKFGDMADSAREVLSLIKDIKAEELQEAVRSITSNFFPAFEDASSVLGKSLTGMQQQNILELLPELNQRRGRARGEAVAQFATLLGRFDLAEGPEAQLTALKNLMEEFQSIAGEDLSEKQENFYQTLVKAQEKLLEALSTTKKISAEFVSFQQSNLAYNEAAAERAKFMGEELQSRQDAIALLSLEKQFGQDSAAAQNLVAQIERRKYQERLKGLGFEDESLRILMEAYDTQQSLTAEVEEQVELAKEFSGVDLAMPVEAAVEKAKELSEQMGISFRNAVAFVTAFDAAQQNVLARTTASAELSSETSGTGGFVPVTLTRKQIQDAIDAANKTTGGGGKSEAEQLADRIKKFEEQLALEKELVGVSEARARILKALGADFVENNPKIVEGYEAQIEAVEKLKEQEAGLKSFAETLRSSLGDAFMSIVDGSKSAADAFKDMARAILKQAFEMMVIKPLIDSLFGTSGGGGLFNLSSFAANGNVYSGGSVTAFADGGVVGGPTYFPMSGGRTGLMGEAGPEAIMPLKRGPDGKLGVQAAGGAVNVTQVFNINGNGDDYILTKIKQQAPKIANLAQKQMMDQRRRGGAMKATFG